MAAPISSGFDGLFEPKTVAVFGSVKRDKIGHQLITQLTAGGFPGSILAVNPKGESPEGYPNIPGFPDLTQAPSAPDLALIAVPAQFVEQVIGSCGEAGVPFAVVFTSGFSEIGNTQEERALKSAAERNGVRLIGPNTSGMVNVHSGLNLVGLNQVPKGDLALISQSGNMAL